MSLFALLAALALGYYRPLPQPDWLPHRFAPYARLLERNFNDGRRLHGVIAWLLAALLPVAAVAAIHLALSEAGALLGLLFSVGVLYLVLRLGHFGQQQDAIAARLRRQELDEARTLLGEWQGCEARAYTPAQVARIGIEATLRRAHYDLFAPIFWFVLLGPAGALLYLLAYRLKREWADQDGEFGAFAQQAFVWLDWLPARFTAASFAVVGDFEDAVYCWRTQAQSWPDPMQGIILASGAGALGVRLGEPLPGPDAIEYRPELGMGDEPDADYLQSATGLVWRVLAVMVGLVLLFTFAHWLGN